MTTRPLSFGLTAFLDILGFKARVLCAQTPSDINRIAADVKRVQDAFEFRPRNPETRQVHTLYKKTVLAFSDCVVVNIQLRSRMTELQGEFDAFMSELDGLAVAQAKCASEGLFLRGGVDQGWWYRRGATLVSQSMVGAYQAESRADVPVIALTNDLYQDLADHEERRHYSDDTDPIRRYLRPYPNGEAVQFWYLDHIGMFAMDIDWMNPDSRARLDAASSAEEKDEIYAAGLQANRDRWFANHARRIEAAYGQTNEEGPRRKYIWLAGYHNEIAARYQVAETSLCDLV